MANGLDPRNLYLPDIPAAEPPPDNSAYLEFLRGGGDLTAPVGLPPEGVGPSVLQEGISGGRKTNIAPTMPPAPPVATVPQGEVEMPPGPEVDAKLRDAITKGKAEEVIAQAEVAGEKLSKEEKEVIRKEGKRDNGWLYWMARGISGAGAAMQGEGAIARHKEYFEGLRGEIEKKKTMGNPNSNASILARDALKRLVPGIETKIKGFDTVSANDALGSFPAYRQAINAATQRGFLEEQKRARAGTGGGAPAAGSQAERVAAGFHDRMVSTEKAINDLQASGYDPSGLTEGVKGFLPMAFRGGEKQLIDSLAKSFISAILRKESGAAIRPEEILEARDMYIPLPGDAPEVVKQKAENRRLEISNMRRNAGPALAGEPAPRRQAAESFGLAQPTEKEAGGSPLTLGGMLGFGKSEEEKKGWRKVKHKKTGKIAWFDGNEFKQWAD